MNKTAKIKSAILILAFLPNLIAPIGASQMNGGRSMIVVSFIFYAIMIPLLVKFNASFRDIQLKKPSWNDNPLKMNTPLVFFQFIACFFLAAGISMLIGTWWKYHHNNLFAMTAISSGLGILTGNLLTVRLMKEQ